LPGLCKTPDTIMAIVDSCLKKKFETVDLHSASVDPFIGHIWISVAFNKRPKR